MAGDLWVTSRKGCEFKVDETSIHEGGSHGSLHREDSTVPLITAGVPQDVLVPQYPRTIDIAPLCLRILGLDTEAEDLINTRIAGPPR